jgi:hypothetical protein
VILIRLKRLTGLNKKSFYNLPPMGEIVKKKFLELSPNGGIVKKKLEVF